MARKLTDFSQLSKSLVRPKTEAQPPTPPRESSPAPQTARERDAAEVLAYFSKGAGSSGTIRPAHPAPIPKVEIAAAELEQLKARVVLLEASLAQAEKAREEADQQAEVASRERDTASAACAAAEAEARQLRVTCARQERLLQEVTEPAAEEPATTISEAPAHTVNGLLQSPTQLTEVFPGELREMVLSVLAEACDAAQQAGRERRAALLEDLLQANPASGELERRRALVRQILKDAGSFNDAHVLAELAKLGIRPVSGRKHWKLGYGGLRLTMAKTPSDYRSHLNAAAEINNRCY